MLKREKSERSKVLLRVTWHKLKKDLYYYKKVIKECENHKLYHKEDIKKIRKQYNDIHNEGGEGYIPHFYTFEEYEYAKKQLTKLLKKEGKNE